MKELIQRLHSDFDRTDTAQWKQIIQKWIHDSVKHRIVDFGFQDLSLCEKFWLDPESITVEKVFQNDQLRVDFGKASQKLYQTQAWQSFRADLKNEWQSFLFHGKVDSSGSVSEVLDEDITLCLFLINRSGFLQASQELQDLDVPEVYKHIQVANFDYRQSGYVHVGMAGKANETEFIQQFSRPFIPGQQDIWVLDHHDVDAPSAFSLLYYLLKTSGYISSDQYSTWDKIEEFASLLECYGANGVALGMKQLLPLYKNKEKKEFFMSPDNSRKLYACQSLYVIYKYLNYQSNKTQLFEDLEKIYQYLSQDSVPFSTPLDYKHLVDMWFITRYAGWVSGPAVQKYLQFATAYRSSKTLVEQGNLLRKWGQEFIVILGDNDNFTGAEEAATYMQKGVIKVLGNGTVYLFSTQPMEKNFFSGAQYIRPSMQIFRMDITRKDECKQSFQTFTGDKFFVENLMQYIDTLHISDSWEDEEVIDVIYPLEIQKEKERILIQKQKQQKKQMYIQQYITKYSDQDMEHGVILSVAKNKRGQISYLKIYSGDREWVLHFSQLPDSIEDKKEYFTKLYSDQVVGDIIPVQFLGCDDKNMSQFIPWLLPQI